VPQSAPQPAVTDRILFTGRVQGVGFRYTTRAFARRHPVRGYVRNLSDGTVELLAQGAPAEIDALLADVERHFELNLEHVDRQRIAPAESFSGFEIRF
jgi:acylphosphatase